MSSALPDSKSFAFVAGVCLGASAAALVAWSLSKGHSSIGHNAGWRKPTGRPLAAAATAAPPPPLDLDDVIIQEQLSRNLHFFGREAMARIAGCRVAVIGLGGVGSHAAHLLLRSGVGSLVLVDFDQVTVSSLNRHALATRADVGLPKATVLAQHFADIVPEATVDARVAMFSAETEEAILGGANAPDFVLDAIDNLETKVHLIAACKRRGIRVLCVGGAGAKADPTKLRFVDIWEASTDPLIRAMRHQLRVRHGVRDGVPVLLSTERPRCKLVMTPQQEEAESIRDYQVIPNFRIRTIPVLGTVPAIFGMAAASWLLCELAGAPFLSDPIFTVHRAQYETLLEGLQADEERLVGHCDAIGVDLEEVAYLVSHVWRGVSAGARGVGDITQDKALHRRTAGLCLGRWDVARPCAPDNLVLLSEEELAELRARGLAAWCEGRREVRAFVEGRLRHVAALFGASGEVASNGKR